MMGGHHLLRCWCLAVLRHVLHEAKGRLKEILATGWLAEEKKGQRSEEVTSNVSCDTLCGLLGALDPTSTDTVPRSPWQGPSSAT